MGGNCAIDFKNNPVLAGNKVHHPATFGETIDLADGEHRSIFYFFDDLVEPLFFRRTNENNLALGGLLGIGQAFDDELATLKHFPVQNFQRLGEWKLAQ